MDCKTPNGFQSIKQYYNIEMFVDVGSGKIITLLFLRTPAYIRIKIVYPLIHPERVILFVLPSITNVQINHQIFLINKSCIEQYRVSKINLLIAIHFVTIVIFYLQNKYLNTIIMVSNIFFFFLEFKVSKFYSFFKNIAIILS